ncbi:beta-catenin-like protein 1 [Pantherophis guttatus]|uniref:Beta-catenin-like protein 1 n=1 Tax=Pantherophis guttatus TaxID=94885 RepID=A0ABM3ZK09_PANGU|nr:beta-catenin-like protein 1 [Pantherophis guttatus]
MDVGELLSYQPNRGTKRTRDDDDEEPKTRHKPGGYRERGRYRDEDPPVAEESEDDKKKLLHIFEKGEEEDEEEEPLDESSVKKMILTFEKRSYKNQELRIKFPDNPEKSKLVIRSAFYTGDEFVATRKTEQKRHKLTSGKSEASISLPEGRREHVCSILASLLRNLRSQQRTRLLNKFTENDSEKVDRLMELYFKYLDAMQVADKKIEGEKHDMVRRGEIIDDDTEEEFYLRRLDAGLFVLQLICYIMAEISNAGIPQIRQRVHQILNMRGSSIKIVRHIIKEYAENIGDGKNPEFQESEQKRIVELLENF